MLRLALTSILAAVCLPWAVVSCGGPGPTAVPERNGDGCAALYDAYVVWSDKCAGPVLEDSVREDLVTRCARRAALPGISVASHAFDACAQKIKGSSCAALPLECLSAHDGVVASGLGGVWLGSSIFSADELFPHVVGTLATGRACDIDAQCATGICGSEIDATCGVCVERHPSGGTCGQTAICEYGSNCQDGTCVSWGKPEGEACMTVKGDSDCRRDLHCKDAACVPRLHVGDPCNADLLPREECEPSSACVASFCKGDSIAHAGEACDEAAHCEPGTSCVEGVCRIPRADVALGGACGIDVCASNLVCHYGVCEQGASSGASCSGPSPEACSPTLACIFDGTSASCDRPRTEGGACTNVADCAAGFQCSRGLDSLGVCKRELGPGEACGPGLYCRGSLECRSNVCVPLGACSVSN